MKNGHGAQICIWVEKYWTYSNFSQYLNSVLEAVWHRSLYTDTPYEVNIMVTDHLILYPRTNFECLDPLYLGMGGSKYHDASIEVNGKNIVMCQMSYQRYTSIWCVYNINKCSGQWEKCICEFLLPTIHLSHCKIHICVTAIVLFVLLN